MTPIEEDDLRRELAESQIPPLHVDPAAIAGRGARIRRHRTVIASTLSVSAVALAALIAVPLLSTQQGVPAGTPTGGPPITSTRAPSTRAPSTPAETTPDPSGSTSKPGTPTQTTQVPSTTAPTPTDNTPAPSTAPPETPADLPAKLFPSEGKAGWQDIEFGIPLCADKFYATKAGVRARMIGTEGNLSRREGVAVFATERDAQSFITAVTSSVWQVCGDKSPVASGRVSGMAFEYKGPWDEGVTVGSMHEAQINGQWQRVTGGYVTVMVRMGKVVHISSAYGESLGMAPRGQFAKGELDSLTKVITHMIPLTCKLAGRC